MWEWPKVMWAKCKENCDSLSSWPSKGKHSYAVWYWYMLPGGIQVGWTWPKLGAFLSNFVMLHMTSWPLSDDWQRIESELVWRAKLIFGLYQLPKVQCQGVWVPVTLNLLAITWSLWQQTCVSHIQKFNQTKCACNCKLSIRIHSNKTGKRQSFKERFYQ